MRPARPPGKTVALPVSEPSKGRASFSPRDLAALRWLAVAAGAILAGFAFISDGDTMVLLAGFGLVLAIMILGPLAVYALRKFRSGSRNRRE